MVDILLLVVVEDFVARPSLGRGSVLDPCLSVLVVVLLFSLLPAICLMTEAWDFCRRF